VLENGRPVAFEVANISDVALADWPLEARLARINMGALELQGEVFMGIALAAGLTLALVMASVLIHYEVLYGASRLIPRLSIPVRARMPVAA
jgi:hypothetical protein